MIAINIAMFVLISVAIYMIWQKTFEWFKEDEENDYQKDNITKAIEREVHLSQYAQYSDRYPPPTFPDDL